MSEPWVAGVAVAAWVAALGGRWLSVPAPTAATVLGILVCVVAVHSARPPLLLAGVVVLVGARSTSSELAYRPLVAADHHGWVRLVTDPDPGPFGTTVEAALDGGQRVRISAGWDVTGLAALTAGQSVEVSGRLRPIEASDWNRSRHVVGRLSVTDLGAVRGVPWWMSPSQWLRDAVERGARLLPASHRPLYTGLVIGDDRFQSEAQKARFRAVGLSHLLAVSGQNVAFVLAVMAPGFRRLGWWPRILATIVLLVVFAVATRLEPSVLRATVTAGVSVVAFGTGARAAGVRALSLAVIALLTIDPFLASSVGFRLSVGASVGILVVGPVIAARLPGAGSGRMRWWREPLSVTLGAQLGVTPLLVFLFGPVALVTVPANLLAGWAAGLVMTWGLTGGVLAGAIGAGGPLGPTIGPVLMWPAAAAVWWIDQVSRWALRIPSPLMGTGFSVLVVALGVAGWLAVDRPGLRRSSWLAAVVVAATTMPSVPTVVASPAPGAIYWPDDTNSGVSVLVVDGSRTAELVEGLVAARILEVDVVVMGAGGRSAAETAAAVADVASIGVVLAPSLHRIVGARRVTAPIELTTGSATLRVVPVDGLHLDVLAANSG